MRLVIAEKPSVAQSIAAVLGAKSRHDGYLEGGGYIVSWCFGHLAELADAAVYNADDAKWTLAALPIIPTSFRFIVRSEKQKQFDILRELMRREDVTEVVNACDAGREGELIFRLVYHAAGCDKPFSRLWISSMEDSAIREGFAGRRAGTEYDALYQSALCRARADWLVGINATRLFSVLYHKTLNVGRVLSPTLNLLVERDGKITMFHKEKYHIVHIGCGGVDAYAEILPAALESGVTPVMVKECVYQATDYLGYGRVLPFLNVTNSVLEQRGVALPLAGQATTDMNDRLEKGVAAQAAIFGEGMNEAWKKGHINRWLAANCFGDYYTRTGLDLKQREMITFCFLMAQGGCEPQLTAHARGNMNLGNDKDFLTRVVSQCLPYIGYPRSLNAIACIGKAAEA